MTDKIKNKVYEGCKIYGPYVSKKDGRYRIVVISNNIKKTISYPKYLMEVHLNRYLNDNETVDHIDENVANNVISNFRIIERSKHSKRDVIRLKGKEFICPICNKKFILNDSRLYNAIKNRKRDRTGPFCSRICAGIYSANVKNGNIEKINVNLIKPEYTKNRYNAGVAERYTQRT